MATAPASFAESISAYHDERWRDMNKALRQVGKKADEVSVHRARVEIKKITALYQFIESCEQDMDSRRELKPLRKIFRLLGRIRDHHRALALCRKYKVGTVIFRKEAKEIQKIPAKIKARVEKHKDDLKKIKKKNARRLRRSNSTLWKSYLHKKQEAISRIVAAHPPVEELHQARRSVKYLLYDTHLSGGNAEDIVKPADAERLDRLQDAIGDWHDLLIFAERLRQIDYEHARPRAYASITAAVVKLVKKIRSLA